MIIRGAAGVALLGLLTGCGAAAAPTVTVTVTGGSEQLAPTQLCLDGEAEFYDSATQQVLRVQPGQRVSIEVSEDLAASGWQVQIFDRDLQTKLGQVDAGNATTFDELTTSDPFPAAFFVVVVQDASDDCDGLSGAWPIGFLREGGDLPPSGSPTPSGLSTAQPTPTP